MGWVTRRNWFLQVEDPSTTALTIALATALANALATALATVLATTTATALATAHHHCHPHCQRHRHCHSHPSPSPPLPLPLLLPLPLTSVDPIFNLPNFMLSTVTLMYIYFVTITYVDTLKFNNKNLLYQICVFDLNLTIEKL
jgi:hypothetical protein